MGVIVRWLLLTGKYSCASDSQMGVIVMWLLLTGKYSRISGSMVDRWMLL